MKDSDLEGMQEIGDKAVERYKERVREDKFTKNYNLWFLRLFWFWTIICSVIVFLNIILYYTSGELPLLNTVGLAFMLGLNIREYIAIKYGA